MRSFFNQRASDLFLLQSLHMNKILGYTGQYDPSRVHARHGTQLTLANVQDQIASLRSEEAYNFGRYSLKIKGSIRHVRHDHDAAYETPFDSHFAITWPRRCFRPITIQYLSHELCGKGRNPVRSDVAPDLTPFCLHLEQMRNVCD